MNFDFVLLIILFSVLRKYLQTKTLLPQWDRILYTGLLLSIALLVIDTTIRSSKPFTVWIAHAMLFYLIYTTIKQKEFQAVKSIAYAITPLVLIQFITDVVKLISKSFYAKWDTYFETAILFAFIWLVAMLIINRKQRKELEKERLKAVEMEKEFQLSEKLKASLEVQVKERTAELVGQKEELQLALNELKSTQALLIQSEKMASLGELTAGIAHEIQNPLNFVNNFSEVSTELVDEMNEEIKKGNFEDAKEIANDLKQNLEKINHHGKRAGDIVKGMLQHSRSSSGVKEPTDINALADEYLRLAYHGLRAKDKSFNATMKTDFDESICNVSIISQDIGRVILNLITNAFYAVSAKALASADGEYQPTVSVSTKKVNGKIEIKVADNGNGIPQKIIDKIFQPFFTTKPTGQGTGLGLSLSYDIVKAHGGELKVETKYVEGLSAEASAEAGSEFVIVLPL